MVTTSTRWTVIRCGLLTAAFATAATSGGAVPPGLLGGRQPAAGQAAGSAGHEPFLKWYASQKRLTIPVDRGEAKVLIVAFTDFQCPMCRDAYEALAPTVAEFNRSHAGQVVVDLRHFPLDSLCNPAVPRGIHVAACESAAAFEVARRRGVGAAMESWLYGHMEELTPTTVRLGLRQVAGLTDFDQRYSDVIRDVQRDIALGRALGVDAVPTLFINGVRLRGITQRDLIRAAIEVEVARH